MAVVHERRDRRRDPVVREVRGHGDHRQARERGRVLGHVERPAPADAHERVEGALAQLRGEAARGVERPALDLEELAVLELRPQRVRKLLSEHLADRDGDVPLARDPPVGEQRAERLHRARADVDRERRRDHPRQERHATSRARARSAWSSTSTQSTWPIGAIPDAPAAVGVLLEAVLVVEARIAAPRRLERVGEWRGGGGLDQRHADVLALRSRGIERLVDPVHVAVGGEMELHLLLAERLLVVHREHEVGAARLEHALLHGRRVNGVAVHEHRSLGERVARAPERVRVVPLLGLRVEDQLEPDAVAALELRLRVGDPVSGEPRHDDDLVEADVLQVRERDVEDRAVAIHRQQRLRQVIRQRLQPPARTGGEHHPDHWPSSSSSS